MKILGLIFKMLMFTSMAVIVGMLHFIVLTMIIENHSVATMIVFGIVYPVIVFITYIYVFAVKHCIIDEIR